MLHQLSRLAEFWVLLEFFEQRVAMFSSYQPERAETHHQMAKTAPVPMQGREQDWIVKLTEVVEPQPRKGQLTTLPKVHTK